MADTNKNEKSPNVHKGHRNRLKQIYKKVGTDGLPPHVVLELLLFFGIPYKDTNEIAHQLINKFGSLSNVLDADLQSLKSVKNMTENAAILLNLISDVSKLYYMEKKQSDDVFDTLPKLGAYLSAALIGEPEEKVLTLMLDKGGRIVSEHVLQLGSKSLSNIDIGKIVKFANAANVSRVVTAHNHPDNSGISSDDVISSRKLAFHLNSVSIELTESFVITEPRAIPVLELLNQSPLPNISAPSTDEKEKSLL